VTVTQQSDTGSVTECAGPIYVNAENSQPKTHMRIGINQPILFV